MTEPIIEWEEKSLEFKLCIVGGLLKQSDGNEKTETFVEFIHDDVLYKTLSQQSTSPKWKHKFNLEGNVGDKIVFDAYEKLHVGRKHKKLARFGWQIPQLTNGKREYFMMRDGQQVLVIYVECQKGGNEYVKKENFVKTDKMLIQISVKQILGLDLALDQKHKRVLLHSKGNIGEWKSSFGTYRANVKPICSENYWPICQSILPRVYHVICTVGETLTYSIFSNIVDYQKQEMEIVQGQYVVPDFRHGEKVSFGMQLNPCAFCNVEIKCLKSIYDHVDMEIPPYVPINNDQIYKCEVIIH